MSTYLTKFEVTSNSRSWDTKLVFIFVCSVNCNQVSWESEWRHFWQSLKLIITLELGLHFVPGLPIVTRSCDSHNDVIGVIILSCQYIWQSLKGTVVRWDQVFISFLVCKLYLCQVVKVMTLSIWISFCWEVCLV